jgi:putative membrane protein
MTANLARKDRIFYVVNAVLSTCAVLFLGWLLLVHRGAPGTHQLDFLPAVNAGFNTLSASLLAYGWWCIRRDRTHWQSHRIAMVAAFASSSLFLVSYIVYHAVHGDSKFGGVGAIRTFYLVMLASHVLLSIVVVPGALAAFYFALQKRFETHKKVTRKLLPIWLYVSVTGVLIFFMLRANPTSPSQGAAVDVGGLPSATR